MAYRGKFNNKPYSSYNKPRNDTPSKSFSRIEPHFEPKEINYNLTQFRKGAIVKVIDEDGNSYTGKVLFNPNSSAVFIISPMKPDGTFSGHIIYQHSEITSASLLDDPPVVVNHTVPYLCTTNEVDNIKKLACALSALEDQKSLAVALLGHGKGRSMEARWLAICAKNTVIMFDIFLMNGDLFWQHLDKFILGNKEVEKIVHDVRPLSDFLFHTRGIRLQNVYDTMLSHVWIQAARGKTDWVEPTPLKCTNLSELMKSNVSINEMNSEVDKEIKLVRLFEDAKWRPESNPLMERPLSSAAKKYCCVTVKYLEILRTDFRKEAELPITTLIEKTMASIENASLYGALVIARSPINYKPTQLK